MSSQISLRPAEERDCELLWRWRNDENTRKWSFNPAYIPYDEHRKWFLGKLDSANAKILIVLDKDKKEIGQVRFDISHGKSADVNVIIDIKERNKGYGSSAMKLACQYALEELNIEIVAAHIKEGNEASIKAFTKAGFISKGLLDFKGYKAIEMVLERGRNL